MKFFEPSVGWHANLLIVRDILLKMFSGHLTYVYDVLPQIHLD